MSASGLFGHVKVPGTQVDKRRAPKNKAKEESVAEALGVISWMDNAASFLGVQSSPSPRAPSPESPFGSYMDADAGCEVRTVISFDKGGVWTHSQTCLQPDAVPQIVITDRTCMRAKEAFQ